MASGRVVVDGTVVVVFSTDCAACADLATQRSPIGPGQVLWRDGSSSDPCSHQMVRIVAHNGYSIHLFGPDRESPTMRNWLGRIRDLASAALENITGARLCRLDDLIADPTQWAVVPGPGGALDGADVNAVLRAITWIASEFGAGGARSFIAAGVDVPQDAMVWRGAEFDAEQAEQWLSAGVLGPNDARTWKSAGVQPAEVHRWASADDAHFTDLAGLPRDPQWGALRSVTGPRLAKAGKDAAQTPEAIRNLTTALLACASLSRNPSRGTMTTGAGTGYVLCGLSNRDDDAFTQWATEHLPGLDWADVATCITAGMTPDAAIEHVRAGKDMGPVRLVAALAS